MRAYLLLDPHLLHQPVDHLLDIPGLQGAALAGRQAVSANPETLLSEEHYSLSLACCAARPSRETNE